VVVEEVALSSAGEKADIRVGDVLLAWDRPANPPANPEKAGGAIESVFDWIWLDVEQGPRGLVTVGGERDGKAMSFQLPVGNWGVVVRPRFDDQALEIYRDGKAAIAGKRLEQGTTRWDELMKSTERSNQLIACWMNIRAGEAWTEAQRWKEAHGAYESARGLAEKTMNAIALALAWESMATALERQNRAKEADIAHQSAMAVRERASGESLSVARSLEYVGRLALTRRDLGAAQDYHARALKIRETLAPNSLPVATSLNHLGLVARDRNERATANAYHQRALAIQEKVAPNSLHMAGSLISLGNVAGDSATAETYYKRALAIQEELAPDSPDAAVTLNNLGLLAGNRGELATAEGYLKRALAIHERLRPNSLVLATSLNNLGIVAATRGEVATAEAYTKRALALQEKLAPDSPGMAGFLNNLGAVARNRGDFVTAEEYFKRALAIQEKLRPDSGDVALSLHNLGVVVGLRGDLTAAETYHQRALAIREKLTPDGPDVSWSLNGLAVLARNRGDLAMAEAYQKRALAIREKLAPESNVTADSLNNLGVVIRDRGDWQTAEIYVKRALVIRERLAPGSSAEAESLHDLGLLYRTANQIPLAADHLRRALGALEAQVGKLGGAQETQAGFGARFVNYYNDYIDLLIELHQPADAFQALERSRARLLLSMLAERDLVFTADLSADLARDRTLINADYDRTQSAVARLNPAKDAAEIDRLLARLRELRDKREEIVQAIRKASPRFASLHYPQPLDLAGAQQSLDAGTLLLAYCVTKEKTFLFVVQPSQGRPLVPRAPPVSVFTLAIGETALREKVAAFRALIQRNLPSELASAAPLIEAGRELFDTLVTPARSFIAASERVLITPDGPLHTLPFGALVQSSDRSARVPIRYLIEWKPLHIVASATVYAELKKARRDTRATAPSMLLAAFGDPVYPPLPREHTDAIPNPEVRAVVRRGYTFSPLPASRREVEGIAGVYAGRAATYLAEHATEERAKAIGKGMRYLHFASHAVLDERFPLNSALALTIPARPAESQANGLLQAWEIFEQMRIDADLVTLSACETGLGKEMGGEGLVGLTRAFQYAGARSVLASLWSVGDDSTAELMTRFYGHLKAGKEKDQALRAAQLELIRTRRPLKDSRGTALAVAHPFHWAAFQVIGDWK
jgi:CHAT domain-containing protein/Tfp pilus assembly protein PilF